MTWLIGIAFLIVVILISVGIHELGHLIPAKKFGVKVPGYYIGFGPTLWARTWRGTEYGVKGIPLGGYVRLAGMLAPAAPGVRTHNPDGSPTVAQEAREQSASELEPGEEAQAFWRLSVPKRLVVMCGGPFMNLLIAIACFTIVILGVGVSVPTTTLGSVPACLSTDGTCDPTDPVAPARAAGLRQGDEVISWDGTVVSTWDDLNAVILGSNGESVDVVVNRDGERLSFIVTPEIVDLGAGERPYVGISPSFMRQRGTIGDVGGLTWQTASGTARIVAALPVRLWDVASSVVTGGERDANGVIGLIGIADMAGTIASAPSDQYSATDRTADLFMLAGSLNMSLFIFNLLPILPLDGGHILGALIEGIRRGLARLRGKPDPGPFDTARLWPISQGVVVFFIGMTLLLIVADIINPAF